MIDIGAIEYPPLKGMLELLNRLAVPVVLFGGAARDLLLSRLSPEAHDLAVMLNDFDLACVLPPPIKEPIRYQSESFKFLPPLERAFEPLCRAWAIDVTRFQSTMVGVPGSRFSIGKHRISIMGQRVALDPDGQEYPDLFAVEDGRTISAVPAALSINCFAVAGDGRVYGPSKFADDLKNRVARFMNPPALTWYAVPLLVRLIDYIERFRLVLEPESEKALLQHLQDLAGAPEVVRRAVAAELTRTLFQAAFGQDIAGLTERALVRALAVRLSEAAIKSAGTHSAQASAWERIAEELA